MLTPKRKNVQTQNRKKQFFSDFLLKKHSDKFMGLIIATTCIVLSMYQTIFWIFTHIKYYVVNTLTTPFYRMKNAQGRIAK